MKSIKKRIKVLSVWFKSIFYDSYTGWNKRRIFITVIICVNFFVFTGIIGFLTATGRLNIFNFNNNENIETVSPTVPNYNYEPTTSSSGKPTPPQEDYTGSTISDNDNYALAGAEPAESTTEKSFQGHGAPAIGDIDSYEGLPDDAEPMDIPGVTAPTNTSPYSSCNSTFEFYGIVIDTVEKMQNNFLLFMDTAIERGDWKTFASDISLILIDAPVIGEQIRENFGTETTAVWLELETVYSAFYLEIYACGSIDDMRKIADGETRRQAIELTERFIEIVSNEKP